MRSLSEPLSIHWRQAPPSPLWRPLRKWKMFGFPLSLFMSSSAENGPDTDHSKIRGSRTLGVSQDFLDPRIGGRDFVKSRPCPRMTPFCLFFHTYAKVPPRGEGSEHSYSASEDSNIIKMADANP